MIEEIFKDISGYEGLYQVSNLGNVRSVGMYVGRGKGTYFQEGRIMKPVKDRGGYLYVNLYKNSKRKVHKVHRLVATAFIENPDNLPEVNHIDENKQNNKVENLEWCDHKQNCNHGTRIERVAETRRKRPLQLTLDYTLVKEWSSTAECGRNGFDHSTVSKCCNNKYGKQGNVYKGYRWVYAEDYYKLFAT